MGTSAHLTVVGGPADLTERAEARLADLERRWSRFRPDSELNQLNRHNGHPTVVSAETFQLIHQAIDGWRLSGGRFDPTVGETMDQAGYDRSYELLKPEVVNERATHRPAPSPVCVALDPEARLVMVPAGISLDLGGIAKGAAADLVAEELLAAGADGCCVNVGGDIRMAGEPPRPTGWTVSLDFPDHRFKATATVQQGAVCSSTATRRRWRGPMGEEHHLRDPQTGSPTSTGIRSVTVISATAAQAEVLTKVAMVSGAESGGEFITEAGATGLFITDQDTVIPLAGVETFVGPVSAGSKA